MKVTTGYYCEHTDQIFATERAARLSEFRALMRKAGGNYPAAWGSVSSTAIFGWLASNLESSAYPLALPALEEALKYLREHESQIKPWRG